jgi:polyferredoxin
MVRLLLILVVLLCAGLAPVHAQDVSAEYPQVRGFFPEADRFGALEGEPRAAPVYRGERLLGYVFLTADVVRIPAYSGKPINTLVGFELSGRIVGLSIVHHEEPILAAGISEERLKAFTDQYRGKSVFDRVTIGAPREGHVAIDTISGATITAMVQNATVMRAARLVAEARGLELGAERADHSGTRDRAAETRERHRQEERERQRVPHASSVASERVQPGAQALASSGPGAGSVAAPPRARPRGSPQIVAQRAAPSATLPIVAPPLDTGGEPLWISVWRSQVWQIAVLGVGLAGLTLTLFMQDWLARRPKVLWYVRRGFLLYTLFFIGWYTLAQLSVVHVLTFVHAVMRDFRWETFLIDPVLFILWSFVAVTLLLWGRGVFCGWLCPYGALQELTNQVARHLRLRQLEFPDVLHERLWAVKYIVLLVLFGISLQSMGEAVRYAEIEPFKTAITLRFQREWPFVLYAAGLVAMSAVNRKFFCKYLCPLGAALTIPGRFRVFDWWLRRRRECGRPCQICAIECEVRAIRVTGEINQNECHRCLDCQVTFYDAYKCPPMVERRKRHERATRGPEVIPIVPQKSSARPQEQALEQSPAQEPK